MEISECWRAPPVPKEIRAVIDDVVLTVGADQQVIVVVPAGRSIIVKNLISSARPISGKPRSCASSSAENTSLVATGAPSPEDQTPTENTYPT